MLTVVDSPQIQYVGTGLTPIAKKSGTRQCGAKYSELSARVK